MIAKSEKEIKGLRESGRILASVLSVLKEMAFIGVSLYELDVRARELLQVASARSAFLGYVPPWSGKAYPAAICTSLNEEVVHGLPRKYELRDGDVLKIDLGVEFDGFITDGAITVCIGNPRPQVLKLIKTTYQALGAGLEVIHSRARIGDVGSAIQEVVERAGFSVFKTLTGHGVGKKLHEEPTVWNYGVRGQGALLKPGMVLAIEPMVSLGSCDIIEAPYQAFSTRDGSIAAHFEKTVLVTEEGYEVLTPFSYSV